MLRLAKFEFDHTCSWRSKKIWDLVWIVCLVKVIASPSDTRVCQQMDLWYSRNQAINMPGAKIATNQIISAQLGLLPQDKGSPMHPFIWGATTYFCRICYWMDQGHLMQDTSGKSTLEAKHVFERNFHVSGEDLRSYHADNGRYVEKPSGRIVKIRCRI